ncbi:MAG: hypothetical protein ACYS9H_02880 [Planctomycetota bacterium]
MRSKFRTTFKLNPLSAAAAYNLCVLLAEKDPPQAISWAKKACQLQPNNARYAYTLAFYLHQAKRTPEVFAVLEPFVGQKTTEVNIYSMLGDLYEQSGDITAAVRVYKTAAEKKGGVKCPHTHCPLIWLFLPGTSCPLKMVPRNRCMNMTGKCAWRSRRTG